MQTSSKIPGILSSVWLLGVLLAPSLPALAQSDPARLPRLQVVDFVDLARYDGRWYEIARYPSFFNIGCLCTTATYAILSEDTVSVANACSRLSPRRPADTITGQAKVVDPETGAKLEVSFDTVPFTGDYWVIDLVDDPSDPSGDYAYAVVGEPSRSSLFILARDPKIDTPEEQAIYAGLLERLEDQYYDTSLIIPSRHPRGCVYTER